jgi:hypothetical protein
VERAGAKRSLSDGGTFYWEELVMMGKKMIFSSEGILPVLPETTKTDPMRIYRPELMECGDGGIATS